MVDKEASDSKAPQRRSSDVKVDISPILMWIIGGLLSTMAALIWLLYANVLGRVEELHEQVVEYTEKFNVERGKIERIAALAEAKERELATWFSLVEKNQLSISELRTNATSRKDPFTGTDGKLLEYRVNNVEKIINSILAEHRDYKRKAGTEDHTHFSSGDKIVPAR